MLPRRQTAKLRRSAKSLHNPITHNQNLLIYKATLRCCLYPIFIQTTESHGSNNEAASSPTKPTFTELSSLRSDTIVQGNTLIISKKALKKFIDKELLKYVNTCKSLPHLKEVDMIFVSASEMYN